METLYLHFPKKQSALLTLLSCEMHTFGVLDFSSEVNLIKIESGVIWAKKEKKSGPTFDFNKACCGFSPDVIISFTGIFAFIFWDHLSELEDTNAVLKDYLVISAIFFFTFCFYRSCEMSEKQKFWIDFLLFLKEANDA